LRAVYRMCQVNSMAVSVWLALKNKTHVQLFKLHMSFFYHNTYHNDQLDE